MPARTRRLRHQNRPGPPAESPALQLLFSTHLGSSQLHPHRYCTHGTAPAGEHRRPAGRESPPQLIGETAATDTDATRALQVWLRSSLQTAKQGTAKVLRTSRVTLEHQLSTNPAHHASASPLGSAARSFVETIAAGVFKSVRTAAQTPYSTTRVQPRTVAPSLAFRTARGSVARPRPGFGGPTPRPVAYPASVSHVGLGAARNFSSARPIFENVCQNVPLGLRALVDSDGIDSRKWAKVRQTIRRAERTAVKGHGRALPRAEQLKKIEFSSFFGSVAAEASSSAVVESEAVATVEPVVLVLPLEPSLALSLPSDTTAVASSSTSYRLLTPTVLHSLHSIQNAYESHAHRIRSLSNRLTSAGVFDDPGVGVEMIFVNGEKLVEVRFPASWSRRDVEQACGEWRGAERWYQILGGDTAPVSFASSSDLGPLDDLASHSSLAATDDSLSTLDDDDFAVHDDVVSTLLLPTVDHAMSPTLLPESSHWSESWDPHGVTWAVEDSDSESRVWASDAESDTEEEQRGYVSGVRSFLEELEMVEREREFRPVMAGGLMG